jgi:tRNA pseudouridine55 synthase
LKAVVTRAVSIKYLVNKSFNLEALILTPDMSPLSRNIEDYPEGIIIPIDKPYRWTSADVIRKVKYTAIRHFGKKNLKVGHAGTLDPLATGVLLVCIGKATKLAEELQSHDKEYVAGITFGATTPSYDLEKEIDRFFPHEHITASSVAEALPAFIGEQDQIAPLFSAKSVDGVRAYELARKLHREGKTLDEAAAELIRVSRINITELELMEYIGSGVASEDPRPVPAALTHPLRGGAMSSPAIAGSESNASSRINVTDNSELGLPRAVVRMACSKGTYVRAFARDLGEALGSGAHLDSLQRSRSGIFRVENALTVDQAISLLSAPKSL